MTQDEIIEIATQIYGECVWHESAFLRLEAFVKLVEDKAIAELESQEPFCYAYKENGEDFFAPKDGYYPADAKPLYTHPPQRTEPKVCCQQYDTCLEPCTPRGEHLAQRTWVGLTDDEHCNIWYKESLDWMEYGKAIEAKLKEKNCAG